MQKPHVLIADVDDNFLKFLEQESSQVQITAIRDKRGAQLAIADTKVRFSAICLNVNLCSPLALPLVRHVKCHRPAAPLYLLSDNTSPLMQEELNQLHIHDLIQKPVTPQQLLQRLIPGSYFNLAEAVKLGQADTAKAGDEREVAEDKMHPIDAKSFLCGQKSFFDLFVKLGAGKFVMILKAGDAFEPARLMNYLNRGVEEFYIKKEAQLFYLQYCDKMTEAIVQSASVPNEIKVAQVANLGNETFNYLKSAGVSEMTLSTAQGFVRQAHQLIRKNGLSKLSEVQAFLNDPTLADHGTATVMITSMMVKAMGFNDDKVTSLIATGALLHDIGMLSLPEELRKKAEENADALEGAEREQYEKHPALGAEILQKVPHINPLIPQIASQHHERRTRKGFPNKLGPGAISSASEMVGLAEVFLKVVRSAKGNRSALEVVRRQHGDEFSLKIIDSFLKSFDE